MRDLNHWKKTLEARSPEWSPAALELVRNRFLVGTDVRDPDTWMERVARRVSSGYSDPGVRQEREEAYATLLKTRSFLPTSSALVNILQGKGSYSGCIVLPIHSSLETLFSEDLPKIIKMLMGGTGVGIDLSVLPPRLSEEETHLRAHPGPVETLRSIVNAVNAPVQYGGVKRSAFMAVLPFDHPDTFEFIECKRRYRLDNVNISVAVDQVMEEAFSRKGLVPFRWNQNLLTVSNLATFELRSKERNTPKPDLFIEKQKVFSHAAKRQVGVVIGETLYLDVSVWLQFVSESAHACGDPGLINLDAINRDNPTFYGKNAGQGVIRTTTPCGEQPLLPFEVCHLGSFNLNRFIQNDSFDFDTYEKTIEVTVSFMDDLVSLSESGLPEAQKVTEENRKIGLGIMGLADILSRLELPYESESGREMASKITEFTQKVAERCSQELVQSRGSFPNYSESKFRSGPARRHATLTTIAPTGHISTLAGCSTGIEPFYLISYQRNANGHHRVNCPPLEQKLREMDYSLNQWISDTQVHSKSFRFDGTLSKLSTEVLDAERNKKLQTFKRVFQTAHEISQEGHLLMLKELQKHVENGVSKTINLPFESTVEEVQSVFIFSLQNYLKGMTVFRDGCLEQQALSQLPTCESCGESQFLRPGDCGGYRCDQNLGGCGYEVCSL